MSSLKKTIQLTTSEAKNLENAFKDPKFRSLLVETAQKFKDPKVQALRESEMTQYEAEKGNAVSFLHSSPGFVLKAFQNGTGTKFFVNVCIDSSSNIEPPSMKSIVGGSNVSIPHAILSQPRVDLDKKGRNCNVIDVYFHFQSIKLANSHSYFRELVVSTALEAVTNLGFSLNKASLKTPKMSFKGPTQSAILKRQQNSVTTPTYTVKYIKKDLMEVSSQVLERDPTRPSEIHIEIHLPELSDASQIELDVHQNSLSLKSRASSSKNYQLDISLSYSVDENLGKARFDKQSSKLLVSVPVKKVPYVRSTSRLISTDSGIDIDDFSEKSTPENSSLDFPIEVFPEQWMKKPSHSIDVTNTALILTCNVQNVESSSIQQIPFLSGVIIRFSSIGSGYFPLYWSISISFTGNSSENDIYEIDVWNDSVIITIPLKSNFIDYLIGSNSDDLILQNNPSLQELKKARNTLETHVISSSITPTLTTELESKTKKSVVENSFVEINSPSGSFHRFQVTPLNEYNEDEQPSISFSGLRGILKRRHRCYSESQADQLQRWAAAAAAAYSSSDTIDEEDEEDSKSSESLSSSSKKSVRFNEVVQRQIFRQNASILGMKHKNYKKAEAKRRRNERRVSESDLGRCLDSESIEPKSKRSDLSLAAELMFELDIE